MSRSLVAAFAYGSNMSARSLRAKGVNPVSSEPGFAPGWKLAFDLLGVFPHEGRFANLQPHDPSCPPVHGVVHCFRPEDQARLDAFEAVGLAYLRQEIEVQLYSGRRVFAGAYVGLPAHISPGLPSRRYLNLIIEGARVSGLDPAYIEVIASNPTITQTDPGPMDPALVPDRRIGPAELAANPHLTAVGGVVFDVAEAHPYLARIMGGQDFTVPVMQRLDTSDGCERPDDLAAGRLDDAQKAHLFRHMHDLAALGRTVGWFDPQNEQGGRSSR